MRVVTANIQSGRAATGEQTTAQELADAFAPVEADVVALQEVDQYQPRSGRMDQVGIIADALGLEHYHFAAALAGNVLGLRRKADPIGDHPGPAYGVALLSRYPIVAWFTTRLPQMVRRLPTWRGLLPGWWVHEPRVGLAAVLAGPHGPFAVASTHLSLLPPVARHQLRTLLHKTATLADKVIVAGDFNLAEATVAKDSAGWESPRALTFHADLPLRQIDHILVRGGTTSDTHTHRLAISDHRALATQVHWR